MTHPWVVDGRCTLDWDIAPVVIGPTWKRDETGEFILPKWTLGWQALHWIKQNLLAEELGKDGRPQPWTPTAEQARFILWWYAIDETGAFVYRDGIFQRLKGAGKDPLVSVICGVEFLGPCRFAGWASRKMPEIGVDIGEPVGKEHASAWIDVAAVSKEQTRNTMILFAGLFTEECKRAHYMNAQSMGREKIFAHRGSRVIRAVTSNPRALEGGRATFVVRNETHHWNASNNGHEMAAVIERNATKSKGGAARALSITNAYEPSEGSVAQVQRESWEDEQAGLAYETGVLYDSLEVSLEVGLAPPEFRTDAATLLTPEDREIVHRAYLAKVITAVRGDAVWLDIPRITNSILDTANPPSRSRRFWLNQVKSAEDAWVDPEAVEASEDELARAERRSLATDDQLRVGWLVSPVEECVMFGDGSKSDDATALTVCRLSDGYVMTGGVWQRPTGLDPKEQWLVPRGEVDVRVDELMGRFNIVAFWFDPSHALDDDNTRYWDGYCDAWHRRFSPQLDPRFWAVKTGSMTSAVLWDMTSMERQRLFVASAETTLSELEHKRDDARDPLVSHDGHPALKAHLKNCRRNPILLPGGTTGISVRKEGRESAKKIDLAVCLIGARMLRRVVLNVGLEEQVSTGGMAWAV